MAVYTEVGFDDAAALLQRLALPPLQGLRGIESGIENTNYFVSTASSEWVLTLFERLQPAQLPFYLGLLQHLARRGICVPEPRADAGGALLHQVCAKPAALVTRLHGTHQEAPSARHCEQLGVELARMHLAAQDFALRQPHLRGLPWCNETAPVVLPHLSAEHAALLQHELSFQNQLAASPAGASLPQGIIHADLFRDNVMFEGDRLSGLFDFFFAGVDAWLFDVAVCLNDWCVDPANGHQVDERAQALVAAYHGARPLAAAEVRLMPALLRAAALRFWLSRLWDAHLPRGAALLQPKDPGHFERVLRHRIEQPWHPNL